MSADARESPQVRRSAQRSAQRVRFALLLCPFARLLR
jgi:hypothetical protein